MKYECTICGKSFDNGRAAHCHLLRFHDEAYAKVKHNKNELCLVIEDPEQKDLKKPKQKPAGFRPLKRSDETEERALAAGWRFVDHDENLYKEDYAKRLGWI